MTDFLGRLAGRGMGLARVAEPVIPAVLLSPSAPEAAARDRLREAGETPERPEFVAPEPQAVRRVEMHTERTIVQMERPATGNNQAIPSSRPREQSAPAESIPPDRNSATESAAPAVPDLHRTVPAAEMPASQSTVREFVERRDAAERAEAPVVRVTIGRVEVRAQFPGTKTERAAAGQRKPAGLSLDDYMKQRREGRR
jgi:hypothetical protein